MRRTDDAAVTVLRVALGLVMLPHGLQKAAGWFGGPGFGATVDQFEKGLGIPAPLTALVVVAGVAGGVGLLAGFLNRVAAASIALVMAGAVILVHLCRATGTVRLNAPDPAESTGLNRPQVVAFLRARCWCRGRATVRAMLLS